jgi:hypothetical protein
VHQVGDQPRSRLFIESRHSPEKLATSFAFKGVKTKSLQQNMEALEISFIETETVQDKVLKCIETVQDKVLKCTETVQDKVLKRTLLHILHK